MAEEEKKDTAAEASATEKAQAPSASAEAAEGQPAEAPAESVPAEESAASEPSQESSETAEKPAEAPPAKAAGPDWKDLYARLRADFDTYKKRAARDREDVYRYAEGDILKDILPSVDNLQLALANAKDPEDPFVKGVRLACDSLVKALKDHGAEPFDSVGQPLDTAKMEAITMMPSADVAEGSVVAEVKKGWMLKEKVLRAAQVVVSAGAPAETK